MKLSGRKLILLTLLGVLILGGLGVAIYHWRAKRAVIAYRQQLISAGEKLTVKELIPPTPAKEDDGAELFHRVHAKISIYTKDILVTNPPSAMRAVAPGKAMVGWQQPNIRGDKETNTWDDLAMTLDGIAKELELLDKIAEKRTLDFKLNYNQGFTLRLSMLSPMKGASQKLTAAVLLNLHDEDEAGAARHVRGMLGLVRGLTDERLIISQLVRIAIASITQAATWELLQSTNTTDAQLETIQREWAALDFVLPSKHSLEMERAMTELTIGDMRGSRSEFNRVTSGFGFVVAGAGGGRPNWSGSGDVILEATQFAKDTWVETKDAAKEVAWRVAWSHSDQLLMLKGVQIQIEALRSVQTNHPFSMALSVHQTRLAALGLVNTDKDDDGWLPLVGPQLQTMFSSSIPALSKLLYKVMVIETGKQLTVTAIALTRYKLRHGKFPADLATLVPEFLPAVPLDPVNAQPLRYSLNANGTFLLYSVGEDAEDNGGNPNKTNRSISWQHGRDWVWPQPATAQEIEDFFNRNENKARTD